MLIFNLPHMSALTFVAISYGTFQGYLKVTPLMVLVAVFGMARVPFVGCCMSICLHRYFAHGAFKTSRPFQFILGFVGSLALQGGVLWWAGKHNRHHKHCDEVEDPHSPTHKGFLYAWLGWLYCETRHDWVFIPRRLWTPEMLFLNLMFAVPNVLVTYLLTFVVGLEWALFLCWVPGLFGALATTHFNVDYHPPTNVREGCLGINKVSGDKGIGPLRLDGLAKIAPWMFEPLVGEAFHDDHHEFPRRAHRPGFDVPYSFVLAPLSHLGIIWDLQQPLPTDTFTGSSAKLCPVFERKKDA